MFLKKGHIKACMWVASSPGWELVVPSNHLPRIMKNKDDLVGRYGT